MGRFIATGLVGCWLLAAAASVPADERPGSSSSAGLAWNPGAGSQPSVAVAGDVLAADEASPREGLGIPIPAAPSSNDGGFEASQPGWGGFIGTLERRVRLMLERASMTRRSRAIARPPHGGPGGGGPDRGDDTGAGQPGPASSEGAQGATLPTRLWFGPPAPNPTSGLVTFRVELPAAAMVRVVILDIAGRLVGEIRESHEAGRHLLTWNGRDHAGSAGVYLARLEVDGRPVGVRRLVVLR